MPMTYDMHIHTDYCGHCSGMSVEAILRRADALGLDTIAITDHVFRRQDLAIIQQIAGEVKRCTPRCRVIIGAEVDVDGRYADGRLVTDNVGGLDYVIAGFHYVPTVGIYPHRPDDCVLTPDEFFAAWRSSLLGIVSNPVVSTLAHPGRLPASVLDAKIYFDKMLAVYVEAARRSAENHIAWEINELTGMRLNDGYRDRWHRIYEIALEAGVKLIYGSDAHDPLSMGLDAFTRETLKKLPAGCLSTPDDVIRTS
ncbi:MAG: PHP domain-containing protein [Phycisphaerae bacterium]|nr:PHP domain-containing protein [Phycisphaerae bacterium]